MTKNSPHHTNRNERRLYDEKDVIRIARLPIVEKSFEKNHQQCWLSDPETVRRALLKMTASQAGNWAVQTEATPQVHPPEVHQTTGELDTAAIRNLVNEHYDDQAA